MKQPKKIKVLECADKKSFNLPSSPIECILQDDSEETTERSVVYISNPKYSKDSKSIYEAAPYIALTKGEYEVVEWTKK